MQVGRDAGAQAFLAELDNHPKVRWQRWQSESPIHGMHSSEAPGWAQDDTERVVPPAALLLLQQVGGLVDCTRCAASCAHVPSDRQRGAVLAHAV